MLGYTRYVGRFQNVASNLMASWLKSEVSQYIWSPQRKDSKKHTLPQGKSDNVSNKAAHIQQNLELLLRYIYEIRKMFMLLFF